MKSREEILGRLSELSKGPVYNRDLPNDRPITGTTDQKTAVSSVKKTGGTFLGGTSSSKVDLPVNGNVGYDPLKSVVKATRKGVTGIARAVSGLGKLAEDLGGEWANFISNGNVKLDTSNGLLHKLDDRIALEQKNANDVYAENTRKGGAASKAIEEVGSAVLQAVPQAALALFSGGTSAAGTLAADSAKMFASPGVANTIKTAVSGMAKDPQYWLSFGQVVGPGYQKALDDGASKDKAALYAVGNGILNAFVEVGGGGIQRLPQQLRSQSAWKAWVNTMLDEGKEEAVQGVIERAMQNVAYQKGNKIASVKDENAIINPVTAAKEFGMGATVGGILGGGQTLFSGAGRANNAMAEANGTETRATPPQDALYDTIVKDLNQSAVNAKGLKNADNGADSTTGGAASVPGEDALLAALTEKGGKRIDSLGSAKAGFDPLTEAGNKYGYVKESPDAARQNVYTPLQMDDDTRVTQTAQRLQEAAAIPEKYIPDIEKMIVNGDFSYTPDTNAEQVARAEKSISDKGWQTAVKDWTAQVRSGKAGGDLVAEGSVLLNNAANGGATAKEVVDLMLDQAHLMSNSGRSLQAGKILNRLTPEGKLYGMVKSVDDINEQFSKKTDKGLTKKAGAVENSVKKAKIEAAESIKDLSQDIENEIRKEINHGSENIKKFHSRNSKWKAESLKVDPKYKNLVFAFEYAKESGDMIAKNVENKAKASVVAPPKKPIMEELVSRISKLATATVPGRVNTGKKFTATELLKELCENENFARKAYQLAQYNVHNGKAVNSENEIISDQASRFVNSAIDFNATNMVQRAIAEEALNTEETKSLIRDRSALGMSDNEIADKIAKGLIEKVGASKDMASNIFNVARSYVKDAVSSDKAIAEDRVNRLVRSAMKEAGITYHDLALGKYYTRDNAKQQIASLLTQKYGLTEDSSERIAESISSSYDENLKIAIEKELKNRFGEKEIQENLPTAIQKLHEAVNLGAFDSKYAEQATKKFFTTQSGIAINKELVKKYLDATTDAERDSVVDEIQKNVADQMPSTFMDKYTALRYLNMLGNFRTQVRNISGNAAMQVLRAAKDKVATLIELTANKASGGKVERTNVLVIKKPFYKFGAGDYHNIEKVAMGNGKYEDLSGSSFERGIREQRTIFKSDDKFLNALLTPVETMRKGTSWMMDKGDVPFSKHTYARNLGGYLQAQGITEEQLRTGDIDEKVLDRAREHAIKESQDATFRDNNTFSDWVSRIGRTKNTPKAIKVLSEGISPFRRTPANVAVRGVEYSPIGLVKGAIETTMAASGKGTVDINAAINNLSKGITGTGVLGLGFALAAEGFLRGAGDGDDKKNQFDKNMGAQDYSLVMPDGTTYTIDWASPAAMPLFVGANIYQMSQDKNMTLKDFFGALGQITDPLVNMSMLSGVNDAINAVRYSDGSPVENIAINAATNYLTQGLTSTLLGQIERSTEDNRKSTYVDKNSELPDSLQRLLGKTSAKTPGWDFSQYDYIDLWGNSQSNGSPAERTLMNFLSPGYSSKMDKSAVNMEVQRLHDATGEASVLPTAAGKSITEGGEKTDFTKDQFVTYATTLGKTRYDVIDDMIKSDTYKKASDSEKVELIGDAYAYAAKVAKAKVSGGGLDSAAQKAKDFSGGAAVYILYSAAAAKCEGTKDANGETVSGSKRAEIAGKISEMRLTDAQKYELYFSGSEGETEKEALKNAKIPYNKFAAYKSKVNALTSDKDKNGKAIPGSLKKKVMQTIQSTGLSAPQKDALYYAAGYKQTTLAKDAPWR